MTPIETSRPHWNHYFHIQFRRTRWIRWSYCHEGSKPRPANTEPTSVTTGIDGYKMRFDFELADGFVHDKVAFVPTIHSKVYGWAWRWWTPTHGGTGGWHYCGKSKRRCMRNAYLRLLDKDQKIIPEKLIDITGCKTREIPMSKSWRKLASDQLKRVENWSSGLGYTLRPKKGNQKRQETHDT